MRPHLADQGRNEQKDERHRGDGRLSSRPHLTIVVELEGDPRVFLESDSYEDAQRLLLALRAPDALDRLREVVDDLDAYIRGVTS